MNNEINRRDFMRLSAASIMTASVTLNLGNTAFATAASEDPKDVLKNFFESFSPADHESWVNYFASSVYGYYREFAQNAFNQAKRLGLLDIDKAELLYAEKVNNVYAPKYYEFNRYYDSGTNYACYKTITDMETETGEYFGNGTNFSLVLMIQESSGWKIGGICKCPRFRNVFFGHNGVGRAFGNADGAVDAFVRIDHEEIGTFTEAVDRANVNTVGVFAEDAGFGHYMCHWKTPFS